jgi:hypothetical protein
MSDGPYRSLPMPPRWKLAAKFAYIPTFSNREIADALQSAADRDCRAELSPAFIGKVRDIVVGCGDPGLFAETPLADLSAMRGQCASPMEAGFIQNAIDALQDGYRSSEALQKAAEGAVADRLLAGYRQVEEHMHRAATDQRARAVRSRLEGAHGDIDVGAIAQRVLRVPDAPARAPAVTYAGLDDGVPL